MDDELHLLLSLLPVYDVDKCVQYFTSIALSEGTPPSEERVIIKQSLLVTSI